MTGTEEKLNPSSLRKWPISYWRRGAWQKVVSSIVIVLALLFASMYGIALWYQHSQKGKPQILGVTYIADYATHLGVDPHETYQAILNDLGVKHLRLVSYWSAIEPSEGSYDFSELDYQMAQAEAHGAKVTLAVGLRQPRWPECHPPSWLDTTQPLAQWEPQLTAYMSAVVERYKSNPTIESYQLENEFFNKFGDCHNFDRARLARELALVQRLDPHHPVIISRSNNYAGLALRQPLPDIMGISIYRRVWDGAVTKRYFQYPFPSWYYAFLAGSEQLFVGKPSVIHELQAEPWPPEGKDITAISLAEQNKTFDKERLRTTVEFGKQTGIKQIDLWGAEYWYYRKTVLHDPSVWDQAKIIFEGRAAHELKQLQKNAQ